MIEEIYLKYIRKVELNKANWPIMFSKIVTKNFNFTQTRLFILLIHYIIKKYYRRTYIYYMGFQTKINFCIF